MGRGEKLYPIEMKCRSHLSRADLSGLKAFEETYSKNEVMTGLIIYAGSEARFVFFKKEARLGKPASSSRIETMSFLRDNAIRISP